MTRRTLLALAATIVAVLLAGCGGTPQDGSNSQNGSNRQRRSEAANANSVGRCAGNVSTRRQQEGRGEDSNDTQIAFTRVIAGEPTASGPYATESELYVMNADGTNETRLTNTPESYAKILATNPDWSPDSKRIAYLKGIDVDTGRTDRDIYVINADGSNPSSLTTVEQSTIAWSPDSTKIAFDGWTRSGDINGTPGIYLINPDGTGQEYLTGGTSFTWSPDSKKIAFVIQSSTSDSSASASDDDSDIYIRRTDGNDPTRLTNTPDIDESTPDWSPDGTKIVFTSASLTGNNDIYVMNSDGSGRTNLTNTKQGEGYYPAWSPDSEKIAFLRGSGIYVMNADGTCERHLTNLDYLTPGVNEDVLDWSPDGTKIAFKSASSGNDDIYVINADGSGRTNLTNTKRSEDYVTWSPARVGTITERTQEAIEDQEAIDSAPQDEELQAYIKQINELRERNLRGSEEGSEVRQLAYNETQQVLGGSDPSTKEKAVRFLARAGLLPSIPINFTDLRGTDLSGANLSGANMSSVNLSGVNLSNANLSKATIGESNFRGADLSGADLSGATLQGDDFRDADLSGADLSGADMLLAQVNEDELAQAKSLAGATMPHGTQHP
jgi:uncharacterized protein YjbI with pentapeptide repeats